MLKILNIWGENMVFIKVENDKVYVKREDSDKIFSASLFTLTKKEKLNLKALNA